MWRSGNLPKLLVFILRRHKKWHSDIINIFLQTFCPTPSVYHLWSFKKKQHKCLELPNRTLNSKCTFSSCRMQFYLQTHCFESTNAATFKIPNASCRIRTHWLPKAKWNSPNTPVKVSEYKFENFRIQVDEYKGEHFRTKLQKTSKKTLQAFLKTTWNIFRIKVAEYKLKCFRIRRWPPLGAQTVMLHEFDDLERDLHMKMKHC